MVLLFSFLGELILLLISRGDLLMLRSYNLRSLSALQEGGFFHYHLIPELLDVLKLLLLLCNHPLFGLFLGFGLCLSLGLLSCILYMMGLHYLLQTKEGLLLLEHFSVMLRNVGEDRGRYYDTEARAKKFLFVYVLLT